MQARLSQMGRRAQKAVRRKTGQTGVYAALYALRGRKNPRKLAKSVRKRAFGHLLQGPTNAYLLGPLLNRSIVLSTMTGRLRLPPPCLVIELDYGSYPFLIPHFLRQFPEARSDSSACAESTKQDPDSGGESGIDGRLPEHQRTSLRGAGTGCR